MEFSAGDRAQYEALGHVTARGLVAKKDINAIIQQVDNLTGESGRGDRQSVDIRDGRVFQIFDVPRQAPPLGTIADSPEIETAVTQLLGQPAEVAWGLLLNKANDEELNWEIPWHQDTSVYCQEMPDGVPGEVRGGYSTFRPADDSMSRLTVARIVLDGDTRSSGCIHVVPGSHRLGNQWPDGGRAFDNEAGEPVELDEGDVLFFNPLLMHRAELNKTNRQRRVIHVYYRPRGMVLPNAAEWIDWQRLRRTDQRIIHL
jgi:ectoine hydroxylase-related dioxygenase (phytanoyl-CoA dioxygenase family)